MKKLSIDACFSPHLYPVYETADSIVVIIDIFRATSAICTAFEVGAERDGIMVEGFDFGNSPYSYMGEEVRGKTIVITTTNGTQAIEAAKNAHKVVVGSFLNINALCEWLISEKKNILLLCSGWKNKFNLEDALFAGAATELLTQLSDEFKLGDACLALKFLYQQAEQDPIKFLAHASHKERLARLNLKKDIKYCLTPNQTNVIPILHEGALVRLVVPVNAV